MTISKTCSKCNAQNTCITIKVGEEIVWLDACYHCGNLLLTDSEKSI